MPQDKDESEILDRAQALLEQVRPLILGHREGEEMEIPNVWGSLVMQTYSRIRSHLVGAAVLVGDELPEEALELVRTMLTDSLLLMEFAARPDDRMALGFGYLSKSNSSIEHLGKAAESAKLPRAAEWKPAVDERRRLIQEGMRAHGVDQLLHLGDEARLARKHGRLEELWNYKFMSTMLHRVDIGQSFRRRVPSKDTVHMYMRNGDPELLAATLAAAMVSALFAHRAVAEMLDWIEPPAGDVDRLLEDLKHLFPDPRPDF
jgi:hypothetical protein